MKGALSLGLLVFVLALLFVKLGVWQLHRAAERREANARIQLQLSRAPVLLERVRGADAGAEDSLLYRRAEASGRYDHSREAVVRGRTWRGSPGVELLVPLGLDGGGTVWVNRGWLPSPDAATVDPAAARESGPVRVEGFLRPATAGEVAAALAGGLRPVQAPRWVLQQLSGSASRAYPVRQGLPEPEGGPHLSYAIQWFAFAAIALVGYGAYVKTARAGRAGRAGQLR